MTAIETALFRSGAAHWVAGFSFDNDEITIALHPSDRPDLQTNARFARVRMLSADNSYAEPDASLPWDIIGFDAEPLAGNLWRYCLHTDAIEYCFEAGWPEIVKIN